MLPDLNRVIEQVSKEKGIDRQIIVKALEEAMLSGAKKTFGHEKNIEAKFNPELGEVELFEIKTVVDNVEDPENQVTLAAARVKLDPDAEVGDELLAKLPAEKFGRIAAQAAKQNVIQRVRDAERDIIYNEFKGRKGELFSGIVQRFEKKNIIVNLGRTDAILPETEQMPRERYRQGDRIRAFILIVPWTSDPAGYVCRALAPAKVSKIIMDEDGRAMEVIVPDDQLSLAIGRKGHNVRLASRLTGWNLDVRSESEAEDEARRARASLIAIPGIGAVTAELLYQNGFKSAEELVESDEDPVAEIEGIGPERIGAILAAARAHLEQKRAEEGALAAAREGAAGDSEVETDPGAAPVSEEGGNERGPDLDVHRLQKNPDGTPLWGPGPVDAKTTLVRR